MPIMGINDMSANQTFHYALPYPVFGRMLYWMEALRFKMYQYFVESDIDGRPINRIDRSTIYQRAKQGNGYDALWCTTGRVRRRIRMDEHSISPKDFHKLDHSPRVTFETRRLQAALFRSIFNVSAAASGSL